MLNAKQRAEFLFNIHDTNSIITGGRTTGGYYCPVNCIFCMCKGDTPDIDSMIPFIEMDELKEGIRFIDWKTPEVFLGDGISKLSAEAFAHPRIYDILEYTCKNLPDHKIKIMTTGTLIREDKIEFINGLKNLDISLSVNTIQEEERRKIMPHPETDKIRMLLSRLERVGVQLLDMGDNETLKADIKEIMELNKDIKTFQLRRIEHSKYHHEDAILLSQKSIANYDNSVRFVQDNYPDSTYWTPHLKYERRNSRKMAGVYSYASTVADFLYRNNKNNYLFCSAESSYDFWQEQLRDFLNVRVCLVKNNTYGGSVTVAGLMTFSDISEAIKQTDVKGITALMLPKIMLNRAFSDLNGKTIIEFEKEIGLFPTII